MFVYEIHICKHQGVYNVWLSLPENEKDYDLPYERNLSFIAGIFKTLEDAEREVTSEFPLKEYFIVEENDASNRVQG